MSVRSPRPLGGRGSEIARFAERLSRTTRGAVSARELQSLMDDIATAVASLRDGGVCAIRLVQSGRGGGRLVSVHGAPGEALNGLLPFGKGVSHFVAETGAPLLVPRLSPDSPAVAWEWPGSGAELGFYGVPIRAGAATLGVIAFCFPVGEPPGSQECDALGLVASCLAVKMGHGAAGHADDTSPAPAPGRVEPGDPRVLDDARSRMGAQACAVYRLDPDAGTLGLVALSQPVEPSVSRLLSGPAGLSFAEQSLGGRRLTADLLHHAANAPLMEVSAGGEPVHGRVALGLPLGIAAPGGAVVFLERPGAGFTSEAIQGAAGVAEQLRLWLDDRRLAEEIARQSRTAETLGTIARGIGGTAGDQALEIIVEGARELLRADVAGIGVWNGAAETIVLRHRRATSASGGRLSVEGGVEPGAEIELPDRDQRSPTVRILDEDGRFCLAAPIGSGGQPAGVIYVARRAGQPFSVQDELALLRLTELASLTLREGQLAAREARLRAEREVADQRINDLVESAGAIVWEAAMPTADAAGNAERARPFRSVTRRVESMLGYPIDAWLAQKDFWVRIMHPDDQDGVVQTCLAAIADGRDWAVEYRVQAADGHTVWFHERGRVLPGREGTEPIQHGVMVDITSRKGVEEERALLISAMEQASDTVMISTAEGAIAYVNPAFRRVTGYSLSDALGHAPHFLRSGLEAPTFYEDLWATLRAGEVWRGGVLSRRKDGSLFTLEQSIAPLRDERGRVTHFVAIGQDATARKELERQLQQAQKMDAVGQLAGGIAHDFNNLLTVILGRGDFLLEQLERGHPMRHDVELIIETTERAAGLTGQLLAFSRKQTLQPEVLNLSALVESLGSMLSRLIGEHIDLQIKSGSPGGHVKADPGQIEQVVMNLVVNARDAMPQGGRLTIEAADMDLEDAPDGPHPEVPAGQYVAIEVRDEGVGMTPEVMARLFEPFFTTKEVGKGTGLGLSTVYGIVQQHMGHVHVESEPGKGSTFTIYLPRVAAGAAPTPRRALPAQPMTQAATVLLVEDETSLREVLCETLVAHGHTVLTAKDGEEAVQLGRDLVRRLDLLVTDVRLPKLSGPEAAEELIRANPGLRVVYLSGYGDGLATALARSSAPRGPLLQKPFTSRELLRKVQEVLDGE